MGNKKVRVSNVNRLVVVVVMVPKRVEDVMGGVGG